jgi:hypothetical protein
MQMPNRDDFDSHYPTPWPVDSWLVPVFWLVVLILAAVLLLLS